MANAVSTTKPFQTTKLTKGTKGSDNHDFKLRVLRSFVVEILFSILPTGNPGKPYLLIFNRSTLIAPLRYPGCGEPVGAG